MKDAPTGVPIIAKHKPNAAMPHGWVATIKLGHGDDEEAGCYDTILHYNGEESFRGFRGTWTGWLPVGSALPAGAGGDLRAAAQAVFDAINADGPGVGEPGYPDDPAYNLEDKGRMRLTTGLVRRLHDALASTPGKKGAGEAIKFAVGIDDHYDRLEFLQSWLSGDTSEWPEFIQTPPSPPSATPEGDPPMTVEEAELFPRGCGSGTYFRRLPDNSWVMLNSSSQWVTVPKFSAEIDANGAAIAAIKFALTIDDHYDRLDFLRDWIKGDVSEWPEFAPTESPSTKEASDA
ncbi:hypothetical protein A3862_27195 [Methylobacterium sp. XJLW]|nr:hypothetical protein A3862_27195 [Methylobacterium sp. XJLW]